MRRPNAASSPLTNAEADLRGAQRLAADRPAVGFDLRLLSSFVVLASELHFGRAAEKLGLAQPALSQQVQRLETQLGCTLFARHSRRVELTAAGTAFLGHAQVSLAATAEASEAVAATERATSGRLRLSMNGDTLDIARELLHAFMATQPDVDVDVTLKFQGESLDALARHAVDASILWSGDRPPRGYETTSALVAAPGAGIALRATHPLAVQTELSIDQLDGQRLIMFPRELAPDLYALFIEALGGAAHFSSVHHVTTIGHSVVADMLGALNDESVTPSPRWSGLRQAPRGLVWKPLAPPTPATLWLVWSGAATRPTRALAAFASRQHPGSGRRSASP